MEQQFIANGGVQEVSQIAAQYVYLDFDGESTSYNGEFLTVDNVEVDDSQLTQARIVDIVAELNAKYASQNVIFITEKPESTDYSTIFVGKTSAFDSYGNFAGLAETIDEGNKNKSDKAFVMLDYTADNAQIISTISHETDHLLGTFDHGGDGLAVYAAEYNISSGVTSTGIKLSYRDIMYVSSGGVVNETCLEGRGEMNVLSGGTANNTTINGGYMFVSSGGSANKVIVNNTGAVSDDSDGATYGTIYISSGGTALEITENGGNVRFASGANVTFLPNTIKDLSLIGVMTVHSNTVAKNTIVNSAGTLYIYSSGVADDTTLSGGMMQIHFGAVVNRTIVNSNGKLHVSSGGVASNTDIEQGGSMFISRGGKADDTAVCESGNMYIYSGGTANNVTCAGKIYVSGGEVNNISWNGPGSCEVYDGGTVNDVSAVTPGGSMTIFSGGVANNVSDSLIIVENGGVANNTVHEGSGGIFIYSGGMANDTTVSFSTMNIYCGGAASNTIVTGRSTAGVKYSVFIESGGVHKGSLQIEETNVYVCDGAVVDFTIADCKTSDDYLINDLSLISGVPTYTITVEPDQAYGIYKLAQKAENFTGTVSIGDNTLNYGSITVNGEDFWYNGITYSLDQTEGNLTLEIKDITPPELPVADLDIYDPAQSVTVTVAYSEDSVVKQYKIGDGEWQDYVAQFTVSENMTIFFRAEDAVGNESVNELVISNIDTFAPELPAKFSGMISGNSAVLEWSDSIDSGIAGIKGYYIRHGNSADLSGDGDFTIDNEFTLSDLTGSSYYWQIKAVDNAGNATDWSDVQSFIIMTNLYGTVDGVSWDAIPDVNDYTVEYSFDNYSSVAAFKVQGDKIDTYGLPAGDFKWRIKAENGPFNDGNKISSKANPTPQKFTSDDDGELDLFFGTGKGKWSAGYIARHFGSSDDWEGTGEVVSLYNKNKITDIFAGSGDANVLVLTDDNNGDALFVEDIFTALGNQIRLSQIDEIRAGNGNDVIDLTSQQFAYAGDGVTVYGGLGNDTIWANNGSNILYGDAGKDRIVGGSDDDIIIGGSGNDSLHGGGGNDIFCFGSNWGKDIVEQLDGGSVTLWFKSDNGSWDEETCTYTDGVNSVTVYGASAVTLQFGADDSLPEGAFSDAASEKIFEDKNKGLLA